MITTPGLYSLFLSSNGISTDSRQISKNKLFFALKGDSFNGNHFARKALENGCSYAIVDDPSVVSGEKYLLVKDVLSALQDLAIHHRKKLNIPIIGLTGSNGKTTTKELIYSVLSKKLNTLSTQGNLNNHIGVPLTILSIKEHNIAIIEMGANHPGEIRKLCEIARPNYGIITNIGKAHLEGFGSPEGIKKTKKELYDFIKEVNGTIFVNYSNPILKKMAENSGINQMIFGKSEKSLCDGKILSDDLLFSLEATWSYKHYIGSGVFRTQLAGSYNLENVLAAISVGLYFDIDIESIKEALSNYRPSNNRSQVFIKGSNTLILDAYNANPSSMVCALENFFLYPHMKKMVILGDMLELGGFSGEEHNNILQYLKKYPDIDAFLVGKEFLEADKNKSFKTFLNTPELGEYLKRNPVYDSLILIKGSRGIQLEEILEHL